jgi:hypothetical protein
LIISILAALKPSSPSNLNLILFDSLSKAGDDSQIAIDLSLAEKVYSILLGGKKNCGATLIVSFNVLMSTGEKEY